MNSTGRLSFFKNELRKWKGLPPLRFTGAGVVVNEGTPGRPPGLQPEGSPDRAPGDAADTRQTAVPEDGHDILDIAYNPITETNINQSEPYSLPEVDETARFACHD